MPKVTRRGFLVGCSAAIAAMAGARINSAVFGSPEDEPNQQILVAVFLRGGCDALNLVPPISGNDRGHYETARTDLRIPASGPDAALPLSAQFGLHPAAASLYELYQEQKLAIVQAVGLNEGTRSHFDAMSYMELGTPGNKTTTSGWLARHLQSAPNLPGDLTIPSLATGNLPPGSLLGNRETVTMTSPGSFDLDVGPWRWRDAQRAALRHLYNGTTPLHEAGTQTLDAVDLIEASDVDNYVPANGAAYPSGSFGDQLMVIAQMIKLQLGLRVATVDLGGWDTHENQGTAAGGYFGSLVEELSQGLAAFYADLDGCGSDNYNKRVTVVVMSEFGRRLRENADRGSDHGHGGMMMVMGGTVRGGLYGQWPGLHHDQLYDGADLAVTTDYRRVLGEILTVRLGNPNIDVVFPGYEGYAPLGLFPASVAQPPPDSPYKVYMPVIQRTNEHC